MTTPPPSKKAPPSFPIMLLIVLSAIILGFSAKLNNEAMTIIGAVLLVAAFVWLIVGRNKTA